MSFDTVKSGRPNTTGKPILPMTVTAKPVIGSKVVRRVTGWTAMNYAKFYAPAMLEQGAVTANVDMGYRIGEVLVTFYGLPFVKAEGMIH